MNNFNDLKINYEELKKNAMIMPLNVIGSLRR